jgi:hypothetical protein
MSSAMAAGNDCPALLPAGAGSFGEPRLCLVGGSGADRLSVCRDYGEEQKRYRLVFRGGTVPAAMLELSAAGDAQRSATDGQACDLGRPAGVPAAATYRGTGVCRDARDQPLPCSVYEHATARDPDLLRYFVYYEPDGRGVRRVDTVSAGRNERALEAELAYQLGVALMRSGCCRDAARGYLIHAVTLFPRDAVYLRALGDLMVAQARPEIDCGAGPAAVLSASE